MRHCLHPGTTRPFHPFLVLVVLAPIFGYIAGYPTSQLGSAFGSGFAEKFYSPGLVIIAAALIAGLAESTSASDRLMTAIYRAAALPGFKRHRDVRRPDCRSSRLAGFRLRVAHSAASACRGKRQMPGARHPRDGPGDFGQPWARSAHAGADRGRQPSWAPTGIAPSLFGLPLAIVLGDTRRAIRAMVVAPERSSGTAEPARSRRRSRAPVYPLVLIAAIAIPLVAADGAIDRRNAQ